MPDLAGHRLHPRAILRALRVVIQRSAIALSTVARAALEFISTAAMVVVQSAVGPVARTCWSRYERTWTNAAGHMPWAGFADRSRCRRPALPRRSRARRAARWATARRHPARVRSRRSRSSHSATRAPRAVDGVAATTADGAQRGLIGGGGHIHGRRRIDEPRSKKAISNALSATVKSITLTPP